MEDLNEIREQYSFLKQEYGAQMKITDEQLREITMKKVDVMNDNATETILGYVFVMITISYVLVRLMFSYWFVIATLLLIIASYVSIYFVYKRINVDKIVDENLLLVTQQMRELKQFYKRFILVGFPIMSIWIGWFFYELMDRYDARLILFCVCISVMVAGALSISYGIMYYQKLIRKLNDIISSIEKCD